MMEAERVRQELLIQKMSLVSGCPPEQSRSILCTANWQFETALSIFFNEAAINPATLSNTFSFGQMGSIHPNTPATPPTLPEALLAFSKLSASDSCTTNDGNNLSNNRNNISSSIVQQQQPQTTTQQNPQTTSGQLFKT